MPRQMMKMRQTIRMRLMTKITQTTKRWLIIKLRWKEARQIRLQKHEV